MKTERQLVKMLPPKQQTLEFGTPSIWQQLPAAERQDCQSAIADLIYQVTQFTHEANQHPNQRNNDHE